MALNYCQSHRRIAGEHALERRGWGGREGGRGGGWLAPHLLPTLYVLRRSARHAATRPVNQSPTAGLETTPSHWPVLSPTWISRHPPSLSFLLPPISHRQARSPPNASIIHFTVPNHGCLVDRGTSTQTFQNYSDIRN